MGCGKCVKIGQEVRGGTDDKSVRLVSDAKSTAMIGNFELLLCQSTYLSDIIQSTQLHNSRDVGYSTDLMLEIYEAAPVAW